MPENTTPLEGSAPVLVQSVTTYAKTDKNEAYGRSLWFRVDVEGVAPAKAWMQVFPASTASPKSRADQCNRFLRWYKQNYPPVFDEAAAALDMGALFMMRTIKDLMTANRWMWDAKKQARVPTAEPDSRSRAAGFDRLLKLVEKSEKWRQAFLEHEQNRPTQLNLPPEARTFEEFEEWRKSRDILGEIDRKRKEATEARDRRAAELGQHLPPAPPYVNGAQ